MREKVYVDLSPSVINIERMKDSHHRRQAKFIIQAVGILILVYSAKNSTHAQEGGIEVFAAETLFQQGWRVSESYLYKRKGNLYHGSSHTRDSQDRLFEEQRFVTGIDYGLFGGITLSTLIPVVYKRQEQRVGGKKDTLEAFGLGDIAFLTKYRIFKHDWERSAFHLSLIGGVEIPSGKKNADEDGKRLPPALQPGSGSWDPITAISANLDLNRFRYDALLFTKVNTTGSQDFNEGDFFVVELDAAYRFLHTKYPGPTASAKIGAQWRHEERDKIDGHTVNNSGSDEILLRPGVTWHPIPSVDIKLSVDIPVYRDFNGTQLGLDLRIFFAFGFRF